MDAPPTHPAVIQRLKRAGGHAASVVDTLEQANKVLIQDHLGHCLDTMINAFRQITPYR